MAKRETKTTPTGDTNGVAIVALLRGINVGGKRTLPMAELRALANDLGWENVATYVASGNLVARIPGRKATSSVMKTAIAELERGIGERFGFAVPVILRTADQWSAIASSNPFADAATERPKLLHVGVAQGPLPKDFVANVTDYCRDGERVSLQRDCVWLDYVGGAARSKLTPAVLDRAAGSTVTCRNLNTVRELATRLDQISPS